MATEQVKHAAAHTKDYGVVRIPYWEIESGVDGPRLLITCAQHGNEVQGAEVVRRFLPIARQDVRRGRIRVVPFCNRVALWKRRPHITSGPERPYGDDDGQNMNRTWPGDPTGHDTERLSAAIYQAAGEDATHNIDIHCWEGHTAPASLPRKDRPMSMEMAAACALPFAAPRESKQVPPGATTNIGMLFNDSGRASLTFELSGQYVIREPQVRLGLRAVLNVVKLLGMLPGEVEPPERPTVWLDAAREVLVAAPVNGLFAPAAGLAPAEVVEEGQVLGTLLSDEDLSVTEVRAPVSGALYRYGCSRPDADVSLASQHPYASRGDRLAVIVKTE